MPTGTNDPLDQRMPERDAQTSDPQRAGQPVEGMPVEVESARPGETGRVERVNVTGTRTGRLRTTAVPHFSYGDAIRFGGSLVSDPLNWATSGAVPTEPRVRIDPADELIKSLGISPDTKPLVQWFMQKVNEMEYQTERAIAKADSCRGELRQEIANFSDHAERIEKLEDQVWPMGVPDELEAVS